MDKALPDFQASFVPWLLPASWLTTGNHITAVRLSSHVYKMGQSWQ